MWGQLANKIRDSHCLMLLNKESLHMPVSLYLPILQDIPQYLIGQEYFFQIYLFTFKVRVREEREKERQEKKERSPTCCFTPQDGCNIPGLDWPGFSGFSWVFRVGGRDANLGNFLLLCPSHYRKLN